MRVVLNGLASLKPRTGVGHHVADLFAAMRELYPSERFTLYPGELLGRATRRLNGMTATERTAPAKAAPRRLLDWVKSATKTSAKFASRFHFAAFVRAFRFDLYHEPNFVPFACHLPTVVTVHDLSVLKFPHWHPADRVREHQKHFLRGLDRARHVIVVSEAIRRELIEELNCPPDRVTTVQNGVGPQFTPQPAERVRQVRAKWELPAAFFLCVGTIEPRKNLGTVIRAFADLPAPVREQCPLVLVGPWGWRSDADREMFHTVGRPAGVRHIGYVPNEDLPALYSAARALLYPSHYEGFGLPPVEMLGCGGAVVASTCEAVREVVDGHAHFIEPEDVGGWRDAMSRAATDDDFLARLKANGLAHAAQYNWTRAAAETVAVYERVLGRSAPQPKVVTLPRLAA